MSSYVSFTTIIDGLHKLNPNLVYSEIQQPYEFIINEKFLNLQVEKSVTDVSKKTYIRIQQEVYNMQGVGISLNYWYENCALSEVNLSSWREPVVLFWCGHNFLKKSLEEHKKIANIEDDVCPICFVNLKPIDVSSKKKR